MSRGLRNAIMLVTACLFYVGFTTVASSALATAPSGYQQVLLESIDCRCFADG